MSDTTTVQDVTSTAAEIGKVLVNTAAKTAAEVAGAFVALSVLGLVAKKVQDRRSPKILP